MIERFQIGGLDLHVVTRDGRQLVLLAPLMRELGGSVQRRHRRVEVIDVAGEQLPAIRVDWLGAYLSELWGARDSISPSARGRLWRLRRGLRAALSHRNETRQEAPTGASAPVPTSLGDRALLSPC